MRNLRLSSLGSINHRDLAEIWNRCWQGYYYDMSYHYEHMKAWLDLSQVSLAYSIGIFADNQVVGFTLLSVDGGDGWIAAACIDPNYRRKGLFKELMSTQLEWASHLDLNRVYLEVLEQNHALKVYQSVGFTPVRELNLYRAQNGSSGFQNSLRVGSLKSVPADFYFDKRSGVFNPAWQRRENYLRRHPSYYPVMNWSGTAGVLFTGEKRRYLIDAWSASPTGADEVITALFQRSSEHFSLVNQPKDWISAFLTANMIHPSAIQIEMCIDLT